MVNQDSTLNIECASYKIKIYKIRKHKLDKKNTVRNKIEPGDKKTNLCWRFHQTCRSYKQN